jgi:hypothetical protein
MIKPTIGDLLNGVATSLRETVLPEMPAGPVRRQVQVAISIIRRISLMWNKTGTYLYADNKDIEETMQQVAAVLDGVESNERRAAFEPLRQRLHAVLAQRGNRGVEYPSPEALGARNLELQWLLIEVQEALREPSPSPGGVEHPESSERSEIMPMLLGLFRRMLERELEVTAPPAAKQ